MFKKLKVLRAMNGDCLLLKYTSEDNKTHNILIDGGTSNTFKQSLKIEIEKIIEQNEVIDLIVITHIDNDHIGGIIKLIESSYMERLDIRKFWFNSGDLIKIANSNYVGISDGIKLEEYLKPKNNIYNLIPIINNKIVNNDFNPAKIKVLTPYPDSLKNLSEIWEKYIQDKESNIAFISSEKEIKRENDIYELSKIRFNEDKSPINKTSISFIVEIIDKTFLFLADTLPSLVIKALNDFGYTKFKKIKVDYVKLSHHGSKGNTNKELLELIECKHFLISTNGHSISHPKPDKETLSKIIIHYCEYWDKTIYFHFNYTKEELKEKNVMLFSNEDQKKYNFKCIYYPYGIVIND